MSKKAATDRDSPHASFLQQYYGIRDRVPPRVALDDARRRTMELLGQWLSQKAGRKVTNHMCPKRANRNSSSICAVLTLPNSWPSVLAAIPGSEAAALDELARLLGLEKPPACIWKHTTFPTWAAGENVAGYGGV